MKIIKSTLLFVILGAISYAAFMAFKLFENKPVGSDADAYYIHIPSSSNLDDVFQIINVHPELKILQKTELSAQILGYTDARVKSGRYKLPQTISSWKLIKLLKSGEQTPLNVVLNNERTLPEVAEKVARYLEPDSMAFINYFESPELVDELQIVPERILCIIIPNTYQFFWNTSPDEFLKRMKKEHDKFWAKEERKAKAAALGLQMKYIFLLQSLKKKVK